MASFIAVIRYALLETFFCIPILPKTTQGVCTDTECGAWDTSSFAVTDNNKFYNEPKFLEITAQTNSHTGPYKAVKENGVNLSVGERYRVLEKGTNANNKVWYKILYKGSPFYVYSVDVKEVAAKTLNATVDDKTGTPLKIRSSPNVSSSILGEMPDGASCITYPELAEGNWQYVRYNDNGAVVFGYSSKRYLTIGIADAQELSISASCTGSVEYGNLPTVSGVVTSGYNITGVDGYLDGNMYTTCCPAILSKNFSIAGSYIAAQIPVSKLTVGSHTLRIVASDAGGRNAETTKTFTVTAPPPTKCAAPYILLVDSVEGGKWVTVKCDTPGTTVSVAKNGETTTGATGTGSANVLCSASVELSATASKSGFESTTKRLGSITVNQAAAPAMSFEATGKGTRVALSCTTANSTIYYNIGGGDVKYVGPFELENTSAVGISAYASCLGYTRSDTARSIVPAASVPDVPEGIRLFSTGAVVAQGKTASIQWNTAAGAVSYVAYLCKGGTVVEQLNTEGRTAAFALPEAGEYSITVKAVNAIGESAESAAVTVTSHAPLTVTFTDWDDAVILEQKVDYGASATRPTAPQRPGYTFDGWSRSYDNVKENITVKAEYTVNTYTVRLYGQDGMTLLDTQYVPYGSAVSLTKAQETIAAALPTGYKLIGWQIEKAADNSLMDITYVDSDMSLIAVTQWGNVELPVVITGLAAQRNAAATGYDVTMTVDSAPFDAKMAKIVAALKTSEDKLLAVSTTTVDIAAGTTGRSVSVSVACDASALAARVEVYVVAVTSNDKTGGALSTIASAVPTSSDSGFSEWTGQYPEGVDAGRIQTKTQYQYRDKSKETTTTTAESLSGWTKTGSYWGEWVDNGSNYVVSSSTREVQEQSVLVSSGYTQYNYHRYYCATTEKTIHFCKYYANKLYGGTWKLQSTGWVDSAPVTGTYTFGHNYPSTHQSTTGCECPLGSGFTSYTYGGKTYYWYTTRMVASVYQTKYSYRDKYSTYERWLYGSWSDWSDESVEAVADSREVQTRTLYRVVAVSGAPEDISGAARTVPVSVSASYGDFNGRAATVMVYKERNSDPTEAQIEYIGQVILDANNTASLTFKTKEEPSETTGDYVVSIALEGSTNLMNAGIIKRPAVEYTVSFCDHDGAQISRQTVPEGGAAQLPEPPQREGYTFVRWNDSAVNIRAPKTIIAEYIPDSCAVAYVDWLNETVDLRSCMVGASVTLPSNPTAEGHTFLGWTLDASAAEPVYLTDADTVSGNMVITADYAADVFAVSFRDADGGLLETQQVTYGGAAVLPDALEVEGMQFLGWATGVEWWNVKADMDVYPILAYNNTAMAPVSSVGLESYGVAETIELTAAEGTAIYYTLDGSDPDPDNVSGGVSLMAAEEPGLDEAQGVTFEYTAPLEVTDTTYLRAMTVESGKNSSEIIDVYFEYYDGPETLDYGDVVEVGTYTVQAAPEKEITFNVSLDENPGLVGYMFFIECDRGVFYVDYDAEAEAYDCTAGDVSANGTLYVSEYENEGYKVLWYSTEASSAAGSMFSIRLKVGGEAESGAYPVKISYSTANTLTADYLETELAGAGVVIASEGGALIGDVSGDGDLTNSDVIKLARHLLGLVTFTEEQTALADVNGDGSVNLKDVIRLAKYLVGISELR